MHGPDVMVETAALPGPVGAQRARVRPFTRVHHVMVTQVVLAIEAFAADGAGEDSALDGVRFVQ